MDKSPTGTIRSLEVGDAKTGFKYVVGNEYLRHTDFPIVVTDIIRDEVNFHYFGKVRFLVYAQKVSGGEKFAWKGYEDQRVSYEFFIDEPDENTEQ